jgi:TRAP transporter TAXI family solute receptor
VSGAFRGRTLVWVLAFGLSVAAALGLGLLLANRFSGPLPPRTLSISTGRPGGAYHEFALEYRQLLARQGFELEVRPGAGSVETLQRLNAGEVTVGFVQGGTASAEGNKGLVALASVFFEPVWVFHRERIRLEYLSQLQGHRIAVGEPGSGVQVLARRLLADNAVGPDNATLLELSGEEAATALTEGSVDAAFFVMSPRGEPVTRLIRTPGLSLMSERRHLAYTSRHPFLTSVRLGEGALDMSGNLPREEKVLLAATASLAVRTDVHPDLVRLVLGAAESVHRRGDLLATGQRFPSEAFVDLPLHEDAVRYLRRGPPWLERVFPFWAARVIDRTVLTLLPLLTILFPIFGFVIPMLAQRKRHRIARWYATLQDCDLRLDAMTPEAVDVEIARLRALRHEIDEVTHVPPLLMGEFYNLKLHIDLVLRRLEERRGAGGPQTTTAG